jgi:hypothetical protein
MVSSDLRGNRHITSINALLLKSVPRLDIKNFPNLVLGGRLLIDPESNLVGESLVIILGWKQSILNYAQVDILSVLVLLEVAVKLRSL